MRRQLRESTKQKLRQIKDDDQFVQGAYTVCFLLYEQLAIDLPGHTNISGKRLRKELDSLRSAIDKLSTPTKFFLGGLVDMDELYQLAGKPLENRLADHKEPRPDRTYLSQHLEWLFDRNNMEITGTKNGKFAQMAKIICDEIGIEGINYHNLAKDAVKYNKRRKQGKLNTFLSRPFQK